MTPARPITRWLRHVRRNVVAYLALFVALSSGSYAASTQLLAKNSVASRQVRNHSLRTVDLSRRAVGTLRGAAGPQGIAGPKGDTGAPGRRGAQGPPGPTAGAVGLGTPPAVPDRLFNLNPATLTTTTAGRVFTFGRLRLSATCPGGATNCTFSVGQYIDGTPVPGSLEHLFVASGTSRDFDINDFGMASDVPAGQHHVTFGVGAFSPKRASLSGGPESSGAIALGQ